MSKISRLYTLLFSVLFSVVFLNHSNSSDFDDTLKTIEIRKTTMQSIWHRITRLSPDVELKEKIDYNKELATADAEEIIVLLDKTKNLWPEKSNLSFKNFTNATPAIWVLPDYFGKLYSDAEKSAISLREAVVKDDIDQTVLAMCNLGKACGTCHANFRRLLTDQLANEVSGWSGQYIKNCE